ncbi:MAG: redox-sensitive transcriptional activator SoxR [Acidimicrobiales bacterium]
MTRAGDELLSIGRVAERTGLAVSAVRFYEDRGLISATRDDGGHRKFPRSTIRRVSFILIAQRLGYSLGDIAKHLERLPDGRTPNEPDWNRLAPGLGAHIDRRIAGLSQLKDRLSACIGCGCLSLKNCALYNAEDNISTKGAGPRFLLGDVPNFSG